MAKRSHLKILTICLFLVFAFSVAGVSALTSDGLGESSFAADFGIFTDYTRTSLKEEYDTQAELDAYFAEFDAPDAQIVERANDVLRGNAKYDEAREFSTLDGAPNALQQFGDLADYSYNTLKWGFKGSDIQVTGIYAKKGDKITVSVDATTSNLPHLVVNCFRGNYRTYRKERSLSLGMNVFDQTDFDSAAIYLVNPYDKETQNGDVKVYIDGGGRYPVFEKGGDENKFFAELAEYNELVKRFAAPDMAEMTTDYAIISTTTSSLFKTYVESKVTTPNRNLQLWGDYLTQVMEFNGIATSDDSYFKENFDERNKHLKINFRFMAAEGGTAAYSFTHIIAFYRDWQYWLANFEYLANPVPDLDDLDRPDEKTFFDMGHELGHMLDTQGRIYAETTNNVTATFAYLQLLKNTPSKWQPYSESLNALLTDFDLDYNAYDNGRILYNKPDYYDHNYMVWWLLETAFPNYWGRLNNLFRQNGSPLSSVTESVVYFSSLATGVDLSSYFERWGLFMLIRDTRINEGKFKEATASYLFKELMRQAKENGDVKADFNHFWYADFAELKFMREHFSVAEEDRNYQGAAEITSVTKSGNEHVISFAPSADPDHLGFEVLSSQDGQNWNIAGFTYSSFYADGHVYAKEPQYKAVAVNRFFKTKESAAVLGSVAASDGVCRINDRTFATLTAAVQEAQAGDVISVSKNCTVSGLFVGKELTIEVAEDAPGDVVITNAGNKMMLQLQANVTLRGRAGAKLVFDGKNQVTTYGALFIGGGHVTVENAVFKNCNTSFAGPAIYLQGGSVQCTDVQFFNCIGKHSCVDMVGNTSAVFKNCSFDGNRASDAGFADGISAHGSLTLENCSFANQTSDVFLASDGSLTFKNGMNAVKINFDDFEGTRALFADGFVPSEADLAKITFVKSNYGGKINDENNIEIGRFVFNLKFSYGGGVFDFETSAAEFVFGSETIPALGDDLYASKYTQEGTDNSYSPGDKITLSGDMSFVVEAQKYLTVTLQTAAGARQTKVMHEVAVYLPRFDENGNQIVAWVGKERLAAGTMHVFASDETLFADMTGFFRYEVQADGVVLQSGYARYSQEITLPQYAAKQADFVGWNANDALVAENGSFKVTADAKIQPFNFDGEPYDLSRCEIEIGAVAAYNGGEQRPAVRVLSDGDELDKIFYTVEFFDNVSAGVGRVEIGAVDKLSENGNHAEFDIARRTLSEQDLSVDYLSDVFYDGSPKKQPVTLHWRGMTLQENKDFHVQYSDDVTNAGKVDVTVTFDGNFEGQIVRSYNILPAHEPPGLESHQLNAPKGAKTLRDVPLPDRWSWEEPDTVLLPYATGAYAVFDDARNYVYSKVWVTILAQQEEQPQPGEPDPPKQPDPSDPSGSEPSEPKPDEPSKEPDLDDDEPQDDPQDEPKDQAPVNVWLVVGASVAAAFLLAGGGVLLFAIKKAKTKNKK